MGSLTETSIDCTVHPRVNSHDPIPPRPRPDRPADVIRTDEDAIATATRLAADFAVGAALRDREGLLPLPELDAYSQSGLWAINVPKAYGGPGLSYATLAKVIAIIAAADSSLAQITQNHLAINAHIDIDGTDAQKAEFFGWVLAGLRFGNAFSELNSKTVAAFETTIHYEGDEAVINGQKFYSTDALLAHIIPIVAVDPDGQGFLSFADRDAPGISISKRLVELRATHDGIGKREHRQCAPPAPPPPAGQGVRPSHHRRTGLADHPVGDRCRHRQGRHRGHHRVRADEEPALGR